MACRATPPSSPGWHARASERPRRAAACAGGLGAVQICCCCGCWGCCCCCNVSAFCRRPARSRGAGRRALPLGRRTRPAVHFTSAARTAAYPDWQSGTSARAWAASAYGAPAGASACQAQGTGVCCCLPVACKPLLTAAHWFVGLQPLPPAQARASRAVRARTRAWRAARTSRLRSCSS